MQTIILFLALLILWLLWSGIFSPLMIFLGFMSCVLTIWLVKRLDTVDHESVPIQLGFGILAYWAWLMKEIVMSSLQVSRIILSPRIRISPTIVKVKAKSRGSVGWVLFANSITLTPGTVTIDIDEKGVLSVHGITRDTADGVLTGDMNDRVANLQQKGDK